MSLIEFWGAIEIGLIYGLVALGVYLSFRVLDFPDLTVDGSFPLGVAVTAVLIVHYEWPPILATFAAVLAGMCAGFVTAFLNLKLKILHLLASILTMTALYSINIRIMGAPNIPLLGSDTLFSGLQRDFIVYEYKIPSYVMIAIVLAIVVLVIKWALDRFLRSEIGLAMRATGKNVRMARANGIYTIGIILLGMAMSNGLVALAGSIFAQTQRFADITTGVGTIVVGLAAVIAGETLFPARNIIWVTLSCIIGSVVYRLLMALALNADATGFSASDLNLVTALLVGGALVVPQLKQWVHKTLKANHD